MSTILDTICARKREEIAALKRTGLAGERADAPRAFRAALLGRRPAGLIAEVKKASPSRGVIRADFDPAAIAVAYRSAGAHCLSVLTDAPFFQGANRYLEAARAASGLPVLRKDFILDPVQVDEAWRIGADAVLLIAAILERPLLADLHAQARSLGLDVLIEAHDEGEIEAALSVKPELLGINNRNLNDFTVTIETTERLAPLVPRDVTLVSESGIFTRGDIDRVSRAGASAVLVGEALMREPDIAAAVRKLLA